MHKLSVLLIALWSLSVSLTVQAESDSRYVSDDLITYTRAGAAENFRVAGTVTAGEEVTLLDINTTSKFAQIRDAKGKVSWIALDQLNTEPSFRARVPILEQQVKSLTDELNQLKANLNNSTADMQAEAAKKAQRIAELEQANAKLTTELASIKKPVEVMGMELSEKDLDLALRWLVYGGSIAGAGLLLGLLLPYLIPRRRRRDRWMN